MKTKKFKPGDWVKIKGDANAPKMEIVKYVSNVNVECVHYKNGERISRTIHQNRLLKHLKTGGIYRS